MAALVGLTRPKEILCTRGCWVVAGTGTGAAAGPRARAEKTGPGCCWTKMGALLVVAVLAAAGGSVLTGMFRKAGSTGGNARLELGWENTELNGDWKNVKGVTLEDLAGAKL